MGSFVVNLHVRTKDHDALVREVADLRLGQCYVAPPKKGWASLYEDRLSSQDDAWIRQLGSELSGRLQSPAIAFLVHDSDFVCYWLFDKGELQDEFNSCPDYFGDDFGGSGDVETLRGRPDVLLRYCRRGVKLTDVESVLEQEPIFAEGQLEELARLLGIDIERAMADFRYLGQDIDPDEIGAVFTGTDGDNDDAPADAPPFGRSPRAGGLSVFGAEDDEALDEFEDDEAEDDTGEATAGPTGMISRGLERLFGLTSPPVEHDPLAVRLVQAAAEGNVSAIEQFVGEGADVNALAPLKIDLDKQAPGLGQMALGITPAFNLFPLLAAVTNKQLDASRKLIELGADVNAVHPLFGTAVHAAVSAGSPELLQLLLDKGARPNERNAQGQTPLEALAAARKVLNQFLGLQQLGLPLPATISTRLAQALPTAGWDACEQLLRNAGGK